MRISKAFAFFGYVRPERERPNRKKRSMKVREVPRKVGKRVALSNRTGNRHRWIGRVDQGVREKHGLGTRQKSGRNFGIWPPHFMVGRS